MNLLKNTELREEFSLQVILIFKNHPDKTFLNLLICYRENYILVNYTQSL